MSGIVDLLNDVKKRMDGSLTNLRHSLNGLRTGRASTALLDPIKVEAYGLLTPLNQLGTVSAPDPKLLLVQVWDKEVVKAVEKAIGNANLGLHPITEGNVIKIPIPGLSEERRKELSKKASEYAESTKIAIRNIRRDALETIKKLEKEKQMSEDDLKHNSDEVQKVTNEHVKKADDMTTEKIKEIMKV
ncbi:ribosome recycling factor [Rickettsiales endosymbiont of Peranema trichophorum]|uniref:ribosome recycling factor n=1 Tax=Rickettsiales endosymbiont of Peranema trichophorum TaxID=2486577 RepID=UPI001023D8C3|nr:ribosome recycling factor [Rickettsiales endosymbiont of Peranema trichophorum]RZI47769.1 ribosome recycling factor [Rickettsiales endosymbiont of Peranema trichophorum]